jgi:putative oxidoreductase
MNINSFFRTKHGYGLLVLRLVAGWRLIAGVWEYALRLKPISEVEGFFTQLHMPFPLAGAYLSVYAQIICGVLFIIGLWVRWAALIMIINFCIALIAAHLNDSIIKSFPAWALLAISVCLLFEGSGKVSLEKKASRHL